MDQAEIRDKIKKAIKAKLTELGCYIDDELPDYIMVMIANKKDTTQMSSDLDLFLGDNAQPFTDWLDKLLARLQSVAKSVTLAPDVDSEQTPSKSPQALSTNVKVKKKVLPQEEVAPTEPAMLTLHAQEDDEVVFDDDDNDDPVETSKPILAKPVNRPVSKRESVRPQPDVQELETKPNTSALRSEREAPSDLLLAKKRMVSTRGDSDAWIPKARVQPSRRPQMSEDSPDVVRQAREPSPRKSSPTDRRHRQGLERRHSRDRSPAYRAAASSRLGNRGDGRDGRGSRDYERQRDAPGRERREEYRPRDERGDDYRPRYLDRTSDRFYDRYKPKRPVWQADTRRAPSRDASPVSAGLSSQIGSVVSKVDLVSDSDDEYSPDAPQIGSVASIIKMAERKSSVPETLQANKKLLLRAMADVTKSLATPPAAEADIIQITERPKAKKAPAKDRIGPVKSSPPDGKRTRRPVAERLHTRAADLRRRLPRSRSRSRSRSPPMSRLLEKYDEEDLVEVLDLLQKKKQRSRGDGGVHTRIGESNQGYGEYQPGVKQMSIRINDSGDSPPADRPSPKFVVTLDGVDDMSISKNLDEEEDIEQWDVADESNTEDGASIDLSAVPVDTSTIPCRYLPFCKAGNSCPFLHPVCKNLDKCKFGPACKYKHPKPSGSVRCKFDGTCTRSACPYTHSSQVHGLVNSGSALSHLKIKAPMSKKPISKIVCRFHPKCTNMECQYLHPKPCKFGISCVNRNSGCMFTHPSLPTKDQLKWSKSVIEETVE